MYRLCGHWNKGLARRTTENEVFRIQLKNRFRKRDETLPELAYEVKRLTRQAYPTAPPVLISILARDHFIDALDDLDLRLGVYHTRPTSSDEKHYKQPWKWKLFT